ncbi:signal peptidase I [Streptococcus ferus]|uniref:signal peptidase I n=1 Tax=Streptococcus ferus TaxID=1345 RepID=UPI0035A12186
MLKRDFIRNILLGVIALVVLLCLHFFVFSSYSVTENDANAYLKAGDLVVLNKNEAPNYKDFVVYKVGSKSYLGRVIGKERDSVTYMDDIFYLNNTVEDQSYLSSLKDAYAAADHQMSFTSDFTIQTITKDKYSQIPEDYYLILNDNRQNTKDSRTFGLIKKSQIRGVVSFKLLPLKDFGFIKTE